MKQPDRELPFAAAAFNLISEPGNDPVRVIMDNLRAAEEAAAAREYGLKMQRVFSECPGFIGADVPEGEAKVGSVVIEPAKALDALQWLKRRFVVADTLEPDPAAGGMRIEFAQKPKRDRAAGAKREKAPVFGRPVQYDLNL